MERGIESIEGEKVGRLTGVDSLYSGLKNGPTHGINRSGRMDIHRCE